MMIENVIEVYSSKLSLFLNINAEIRCLTDDCGFAEGPVWDDDNERLLFSDIPRNCINSIEPGGKKIIFLDRSGWEGEGGKLLSHQVGSNGLAFDHERKLIICRHGDHSLGRLENGVVKKLVSDYNGKPFNSPNDLAINSKGFIFFSDPPYGLHEEKLNKEVFQPVAGVYFFNGDTVSLIDDSMNYPNGICFSPQEKYFYVSTTKKEDRRLMRFEEKNGEYSGSIFARENADGIKSDVMGNLYLANEEGVIILSPESDKLGMIRLGHIPTNLCWGGRDRKTLFVTAREAVYLVSDLLL